MSACDRPSGVIMICQSMREDELRKEGAYVWCNQKTGSNAE